MYPAARAPDFVEKEEARTEEVNQGLDYSLV